MPKAKTTKSSTLPTDSDLNRLTKTILAAANPEKAKLLQRFFKTAPGQYGHGDIFHGITVPHQRLIAKQFLHLEFPQIQKLLNSKFHEERLIALLILVQNFETATKQKNSIQQQSITDFYLKNSTKINNWDLVDLSAGKILGSFLLTRPRKILYKLVKSKNLWERRIAIIATSTFIRNKDFSDTLQISELLLNDRHDLMHKAVGWMLREVGKVDRPTLDKFLHTHYHEMPRTALRYAIEHYPEAQRQKFLKGLI